MDNNEEYLSPAARRRKRIEEENERNRDKSSAHRRQGQRRDVQRREVQRREVQRREDLEQDSVRTKRRQSSQNTPSTRQKRNALEERPKRSHAKVKPDIIGKIISQIAFVATFIFIISLIAMGLLPWIYVAIIAILLVAIAFAIRTSQTKKFQKRGFGKFCGVMLTAMLLIGSYYCIMILMLLINISGENDSTANLSQDTYSVYISGVDVYGDVDQDSRSDVNLIATANSVTGQVLLTTTPRDYYVVIPGVSGDQKDKLTHAGNYGVETSIATLAELYDEEIEFYIRLNFTSFIDIIDVLGGVTVDSEIAFTTSENSGCVTEIVEGENELTGEEALAFVRERYNLDDGDTQRGINQQIMLESIFKELMSPTTIFKLNDMLACIEGEVETNMTTSQLQACSRGVLRNGLGLNIYSVAATGTSDRAYCYSYSANTLYVTIPDEDSVNEISGWMDDVANGEELPEE